MNTEYMSHCDTFMHTACLCVCVLVCMDLCVRIVCVCVPAYTSVLFQTSVIDTC